VQQSDQDTTISFVCDKERKPYIWFPLCGPSGIQNIYQCSRRFRCWFKPDHPNKLQRLSCSLEPWKMYPFTTEQKDVQNF